jgi:hypothetical protein
VGVVEGDGIPPARREATLVWAPTCERGEDGLKVNVEAEGRDGIVGEVLVPKVKPKIKVQFDVEEKDPIRGPIPIVESSSPLTDYWMVFVLVEHHEPEPENILEFQYETAPRVRDVAARQHTEEWGGRDIQSGVASLAVEDCMGEIGVLRLEVWTASGGGAGDTKMCLRKGWRVPAQGGPEVMKEKEILGGPVVWGYCTCSRHRMVSLGHAVMDATMASAPACWQLFVVTSGDGSAETSIEEYVVGKQNRAIT